MHFLPIDEGHMKQLDAKGFRRGFILKEQNPGVPEDVPTVDFSGWPIFTSTQSPDRAIRAVCMALHARQDRLIIDGKPLPLAQMVHDTPEGPLEVPLHPAAEQAWRDLGYL